MLNLNKYRPVEPVVVNSEIPVSSSLVIYYEFQSYAHFADQDLLGILCKTRNRILHKLVTLHQSFGENKASNTSVAAEEYGILLNPHVKMLPCFSVNSKLSFIYLFVPFNSVGSVGEEVSGKL